MHVQCPSRVGKASRGAHALGDATLDHALPRKPGVSAILVATRRTLSARTCNVSSERFLDMCSCFVMLLMVFNA